MNLLGQHILSSDIFDRQGLEQLFELADILEPVASGKKISRILEGAVMGSLFFEASTRTRLSFETAFLRLGGTVSSMTDVISSSIVKGESLSDTSRVVSGYFDILVVRHPNQSTLSEMAQTSRIPIINAGNGSDEHPSQALLDLYTLNKEFTQRRKTIDGSRIALVGDLRFGRTIHSLLKVLSLYPPLNIVCIAPKTLSLPKPLLEWMQYRGHHIEETDQLSSGLKDVDAIYTTRIQKERFSDALECPDMAHFQINTAQMEPCPDAVILHPLPRDSRLNAYDLSTDLDQDPRLAIFRQSDAGVPIRMALFAMILGVAESIPNSLRSGHWFQKNL